MNSAEENSNLQINVFIQSLANFFQAKYYLSRNVVWIFIVEENL